MSKTKTQQAQPIFETVTINLESPTPALPVVSGKQKSLANLKKGNSRAGIPNKNTKAIKEMILGALEDAGGQDYLLGQATTNPVAFMGLIAKILPAEVKNQMEGGIVVHFTTGVPRE